MLLQLFRIGYNLGIYLSTFSKFYLCLKILIFEICVKMPKFKHEYLDPQTKFFRKKTFFTERLYSMLNNHKTFFDNKLHHIYRNCCWNIAINSQKTLPRPAKKSKKYNLLKIDYTHNLESFGLKKFFGELAP